jgi:hypothetical protein
MNQTMSKISNKLSNIVAEVELDLGGGMDQGSIFQRNRMPSILGTGIESNKISAIGISDFARKDSPFWENNDNVFDLPSNSLYGIALDSNGNELRGGRKH